MSVFPRDSLGTTAEDTTLSGSLAAGFENWRTQVWGSPMVRALGAQYFPQLAVADLCVDAREVTAFLGECALLRKHLDAIAAAVALSRSPGKRRELTSNKTAG